MSEPARAKVSVFCYGEGDDPPKPEHDDAGDHDETVAAQFDDLGAAVLGLGQENNHVQALRPQCTRTFLLHWRYLRASPVPV